MSTTAVSPTLTGLGGEHGAEPVPPEADGFVAITDAALKQQVLDVP